MKYPNIKAAKLSHAQIAKAFGYKTVESFNRTSSHKRHMRGVEKIIEMIGLIKEQKKEELIERIKNNNLFARATLYPGKSYEEVVKILNDTYK